VAEDRTTDDEPDATGTDSNKRKSGWRWDRLSSGAKAGIIGGGCGGLMLLFILCAGIVSLVNSKTKDGSEGSSSDKSRTESKSGSDKPSRGGGETEYEKGFQTGLQIAASRVAAYKDIPNNHPSKEEWRVSCNKELRELEESYHKTEEMYQLTVRHNNKDESIREAAQRRKGIADGYRKAIRDAGIR
jgi:hypothetical protein